MLRWAGAGALGLLSLNAGCAMLTGALALGGSMPSTSSYERFEPLGERSRRVEVNAGLSPFRLECRLFERSARERVHHETAGFDMGGRLAYGFIGVAEGGLATLLWYGATQDEGSVPLGIVAAIASLDALATLILSYALPNYRRVEDSERAGVWRSVAQCPSGLNLSIEGRTLLLNEQGRLSTQDERWLVERWVQRGQGAELRLGDRVTQLVPSIDHRCHWARALNLVEKDTLCASVRVAPLLMSGARPTGFGIAPLQVVLELGASP
ncbi:MAG: hypothetical protein JNK72_26260 [Myxococcales bacterium]|nr:hypothetical protein [Myxococcales bacterium]